MRVRLPAQSLHGQHVLPSPLGDCCHAVQQPQSPTSFQAQSLGTTDAHIHFPDEGIHLLMPGLQLILPLLCSDIRAGLDQSAALT